MNKLSALCFHSNFTKVCPFGI